MLDKTSEKIVKELFPEEHRKGFKLMRVKEEKPWANPEFIEHIRAQLPGRFEDFDLKLLIEPSGIRRHGNTAAHEAGTAFIGDAVAAHDGDHRRSLERFFAFTYPKQKALIRLYVRPQIA